VLIARSFVAKASCMSLTRRIHASNKGKD